MTSLYVFVICTLYAHDTPSNPASVCVPQGAPMSAETCRRSTLNRTGRRLVAAGTRDERTVELICVPLE